MVRTRCSPPLFGASLLWLSAFGICPSIAGDASIANPPPARFDHLPTIPVTIESIDAADVCLGKPAGNDWRGPGRVIACSVVLHGEGLVYVDRSLEAGTEIYLQAIRHELAHINGWPDSHPR